jgi:endogenous inhibitor of DNA gyrase (YacG/DUF329 family)
MLVNCPRCNTVFENHTKTWYNKFCSRKCANSHTWSEEAKLLKSTSAKNSEKVKAAGKKYGREKALRSAASKLKMTFDDYVIYRLGNGGGTFEDIPRRKQKIPRDLWKRIPKRIVVRKCKYCHTTENIQKRKSICEDCRKGYYKFYRPSCEFRFSLRKYSEWFGVDLLIEHGMYSPSNKKNNLDGVSRDHLLSVSAGFKQGIDPAIISHPANCEYMLHRVNQRKHTKSSITLEQLLVRIEEFEKLYGKYTRPSWRADENK